MALIVHNVIPDILGILKIKVAAQNKIAENAMLMDLLVISVHLDIIFKMMVQLMLLIVKIHVLQAIIKMIVQILKSAVNVTVNVKNVHLKQSVPHVKAPII